ncbi:MAG: helical backbone metal receptor [Endomicrobium sp.]|jgi:iron complex transport system substrate-binding protein|nr:helical backbone metal receptor [Endomicrobium sp.]
MKNKIFIIISLIFLFSVQLYAGKYSRIISLAPSVTESLYDLDMDKEVIAITIYCPKGKSQKEIIGTLLEPYIEKIVMLKPDLIISAKEGNNKAAVEKIQRLGFEVYVMETAGNFKEICGNFLALAEKLKKEEKAKDLISKAEKEVLSIYSKTALLPKERVFWEVGAKPLYTTGKHSFINDYNYYTSTVNIYNDINMRYPSVNIEDVVERNPDVIIMVNMGDISKDEIQNWKKYSAVSAVRNDKVYMIDVNDIFTPTPSTFAKGVKILAKTIFPEIFGGK